MCRPRSGRTTRLCSRSQRPCSTTRSSPATSASSPSAPARARRSRRARSRARSRRDLPPGTPPWVEGTRHRARRERETPGGEARWARVRAAYRRWARTVVAPCASASDCDLGVAQWSPYLLEMLIDASSLTADMSAAHLLRDDYCRLSPYFEEALGLDDPSTTGQQKGAKFSTLKAHISASFHSFQLIVGRVIISPRVLVRLMLFLTELIAKHSS